MTRAPFQVLVYPYLRLGEQIEYALFHRADSGIWQAVSGGGEDNETPLQAAQREAFEEAGILPPAEFLCLDTRESVPALQFKDYPTWGEPIYVIPQYCFGVQLSQRRLALSPEHTEAVWLPYAQALGRLHYDGNRTALWELECRLRGQKFPFDDGRASRPGRGT